MVRGRSSPVVQVPGTYQWAEMLRMALGSGSSPPSSWNPRLLWLSSMAFIGDPWPTNRTGMRFMTQDWMPQGAERFPRLLRGDGCLHGRRASSCFHPLAPEGSAWRSEERRVGKECRFRWGRNDQ